MKVGYLRLFWDVGTPWFHYGDDGSYRYVYLGPLIVEWPSRRRRSSNQEGR